MQPPAPPPILPLASDADDDGVGFVTGAAPSHGGAPRAPRGAAAFDVDAGDLLDWEAYGGACVGWARGGMDRESAGSFMFLSFFSSSARRTLLGVPLPPPPTWWLSLTPRRRRAAAATAAAAAGVLLLLAGAALVAAPRRWPRDPECAWSRWRLPDGVAPVSYDLEWDIDLGAAPAVAGSVAATLAVGASPPRCLVLHSAGPRWREVAVVGVGRGGAAAAHTLSVARDVRFRRGAGQATVRLPARPPPHTALTLTIRFAFPLQPALSGLYLSTWNGSDGAARRLAATQFEANAARAAVPCWDEPARKAVWRVTLVAERGLTVLANMPAAGEPAERGGGRGGDGAPPRVATLHAPTPPMSSYLLAAVVGRLDAATVELPEPGEGVVWPAAPPGAGGAPRAGAPRLLRVWSRAGTATGGPAREQAAATAASALAAHERLLGVAFPLPKLDLVAVPDFSAGAMEVGQRGGRGGGAGEVGAGARPHPVPPPQPRPPPRPPQNWGLVTFRESALLLPPTPPASATARTALIIAHELAHMWCGDLVTPAWWGDLWLSEGCARWLEHAGAAAADPASASSYWDPFWPDVTARWLRSAARPGAARALSTRSGVDTDAGIESQFDATAYEGGAAVLRMLRAYGVRTGEAGGREVGARGGDPARDPFVAGLSSYLTARAYADATPENLFDALSSSLGANVSAWASSWARQRGAPLVRADLAPGGAGVVVSQTPHTARGAPSLACREGAPVARDGGPAGGRVGSHFWRRPMRDPPQLGQPLKRWRGKTRPPPHPCSSPLDARRRDRRRVLDVRRHAVRHRGSADERSGRELGRDERERRPRVFGSRRHAPQVVPAAHARRRVPRARPDRGWRLGLSQHLHERARDEGGVQARRELSAHQIQVQLESLAAHRVAGRVHRLCVDGAQPLAQARVGGHWADRQHGRRRARRHESHAQSFDVRQQRAFGRHVGAHIGGQRFGASDLVACGRDRSAPD